MTDKPERLTQEELAELIEALNDGFVDWQSVQHGGELNVKFPAAETIAQGLTPLSILTRGSYQDDEESGDLDSIMDESDAPNWFDTVPVQFNIVKLRAYFENRTLAYANEYLKDDLGFVADPREADRSTEEGNKYFGSVENLIWVAMTGMPLSKPWYEARCLELIESLELYLESVAKHPNLARHIIVPHVGKLGRLVEQYRWKFAHEAAAITGTAVRQGAERGGEGRSAASATSQAPLHAEMGRRVEANEKLSKVAADIVARDRLDIQPRSLERSFNRWRRKRGDR